MPGFDTNVISNLIAQGWSPQEAIAAAAELSDSSAPGEARVYKETPGGLQRQYAYNVEGRTPELASALAKGDAAIKAGLKTLGEPATDFDLTRAKMRDGFYAAGGALDMGAAEREANKLAQPPAPSMPPEIEVRQETPEQKYQRIKQEYLKAEEEYKASLQRSSDSYAKSGKAYKDQESLYHNMAAPLQPVFGAMQIPGQKEREAQRNEQVSATKMLREYIMAQDAQRAEEEKKRALGEMVHNLRRGLDNIAQARQHGFQLTPDSMNVVNQFPGTPPEPQDPNQLYLPTDPNYKGP